MYEVLVTLRSDLQDQVVARYGSDVEAQECAYFLVRQNHDLIVRAWVRLIRKAKANS